MNHPCCVQCLACGVLCVLSVFAFVYGASAPSVSRVRNVEHVTVFWLEFVL